MKKEYDFSKGERGKFYNMDAKLNMPVYLDDDVRQFVQGIAERQNTDMAAIVNQLLKTDMELVNAVK